MTALAAGEPVRMLFSAKKILQGIREGTMRIRYPRRWSPEQLTILTRTPRPVEIIKGAAGSGKTFTALRKMTQTINYLFRRGGTPRVQILSFNRTLRSYVDEILTYPEFRKYLPDSENLDLNVDTFAGWACGICDCEPMERTSPQQYLGTLQGSSPNHPLASRYDKAFLAEEMEYVLKRFPHDDLGSYIGATRAGRGQKPAITAEERKILIEEYIVPYGAWKAKNGEEDWYDLAWRAYESTSPAYDIIVVDEGQDFTANQYRAIVKSLLPDSSLICVVDTAQNIYLNGFTWSECGIDAIRYQPQTLGHNFRNTRQIAQLAQALLDGLELDENGVMPVIDEKMPSGPVPVLLEGKFSDQLSVMIEQIKKAESNEETSAIFIKAELWFKEARRRLKEAGIHFDEIVKAGEWPDTGANVVLSTMHSAKGLEFDHVFMPGVNRELFPLYPPTGQEAAERDRRLLAMAVGRARQKVTIGQKPGEACPYFDPLPETLLRRVRV